MLRLGVSRITLRYGMRKGAEHCVMLLHSQKFVTQRGDNALGSRNLRECAAVA